MFDNKLTKSENYTFGRGVIVVAILDALGRPRGERDLGNTPGFTISVSTDRFTHTSSRSGQAKTDLDIPVATKLSGKIDIEDMSPENQALFLAGSVGTVTQAANPVTNERIYNLESDRYYQLGVSTQNPTGVRGVSAVTLKVYELLNAVARVNTTAYAKGDIFKSTTNVFIVTVAGTTAGSAPSFDTTAVGNTTTDGTATVAFIGTTSAYTVTTDYLLSTDAARFGVVAGSNLGKACDLAIANGVYLSANVDYTPAANSRTQITSSGSGSVTAQLRFIADNATGDNRDLFIASCSLSPSGDNPFITGNDISKFSIDIGINERDSSTAQVIIDGRPAGM